MIERLNHAVNFGIESFRQQVVPFSCTEQEVKLVTRIKGKEGLQGCVSTGKAFPFHD